MADHPFPGRRPLAAAALTATALLLVACISSNQPPVTDTTQDRLARQADDPAVAASTADYPVGTGPDPVLPAPDPSTVPVVELAATPATPSRKTGRAMQKSP